MLCATGHEGSPFPWLCATPFRKGRERAIEGSIFVAQCSTVRRCSPQGMPSRPPTPHCHVVIVWWWSPGHIVRLVSPLSRGRAAAQAQSSAQSPRRQGANHHHHHHHLPPTTYHLQESRRISVAWCVWEAGISNWGTLDEDEGREGGGKGGKERKKKKRGLLALGWVTACGTVDSFGPKDMRLLMYRHGAAKLSTAAGGRGLATRRAAPQRTHALLASHSY